MKKSMKNRLVAMLLAVCAVLGMGIPAQASSIQDGSKTCTIALAPIHNYLETTAGTWLRAGGYNYTTNDGLTGPAYCIDHGLAYTSKVLPITGKYEASPQTAGAFANGYPQHSLSTFLELYLDGNPILSCLTEYEYRYATQLAVWATLGQLAIDGTAFNSGRERIAQPSGDAQQMRVFRAVQCILNAAKNWDKVYKTGMYIRTEDNVLGGNTSIPKTMTLEGAANENVGGIRLEVIDGVSYYTKEYIFASATSTYYQDYTIDVWATNCPAGTIFTDLNNVELVGSTWHDTKTWRLPVESKSTNLNYNGFEYSGKAKLCVPVDTITPSGEITVHCAAQIMQYDIYLAENESYSEQSYIIADPSKGAMEADAVLSWGGPITEMGTLQVLKVGGGNVPLEGATFTLTGSDGSSRTGTTDKNGTILWDRLYPGVTYTLTETDPPAGYAAVEPQTLTVQAAKVTYLTVKDDPQHTLTVHKLDRQTGYSLRGCVIQFERIDGSFKTTGTTDAAGNIQLNADQLPIGSYRVSEVAAPQGYELDSTVQTVHWDGKADMTLTFRNTRKPTLIINKQDAQTSYSLPGTTFEVYKNGALIDTVTTNENGLAYVSGIGTGYYEVKETIAPEGYTLNSKVYGVNIDLYDPATSDDPRLVVQNEAKPSLIIKKYDSQTKKPLADTTFEVYRDAALIGTYTTDKSGEIVLTGLEPGTYLVKEVATQDTHVVNSTPQQIELKAGQSEAARLVFFNTVKPGIHLIKVDSETMLPLPNATYLISKVGGSFSQEYTTGADGEIDLTALEPGVYQVQEVKAPDGYLMDDGVRTVQVNAGEDAYFVFTDTPKPSLTVVKYDPLQNQYLAGATFRVAKVEDGSHYLDRVTDTSGRIEISGLEPGVYSVQEVAAPAGYVLNDTEYHVELFPGKDSELVVVNEAKPDLKIVKSDAVTGEPVAGVTFTIKEADGHTITTEATDQNGEIVIEDMDPGVVEVWERSVPSNYLLNEEHQLITLVPNRTATLRFQNYPKPGLTVTKLDSVTGGPVKGAKFHVTYASNSTFTGEINDLGSFTTDESGVFSIASLQDGWYRVEETEPARGYAIKEPAVQDCYIKAGTTKALTFENTPLSALVVWKYDSVTGAAVEGATFQVRYLAGTSGTGGTVIGTYKTSANGSFTVTALQAGTYIVEELASDESHVIDAAPQTAYISGEEQDVVQLFFGNAPKGSLLVKKVDAATGKPLSDVEFLVTTSDGTVVGDANGKFVTDSNGSFTVDGIEPGVSLIVKETRAKDGFILDNTPQTARIKAGQTVTLEFRNQPNGSVLVKKVDAVTGKPLSDVEFLVTTTEGTVVGSANGKYVTDASGSFIVNGISPGTALVIRESRAKAGYILDDTPQTVVARSGKTVTVEFRNQPKGALVIVKRDANTKEPLEGAEFRVTTSDGRYVDAQGGVVSSNGLYTTDKNGQIVLTGLEPNTFVVTEVKAPSGYVLDETPQTVAVNTNDTQTLYFYDEPIPTGDLKIVKLDEESRQPIRGVEFAVSRINGERLGIYRTNSQGIVYLEALEPGWYTVQETKAASDYKLDAEPKDIEVKQGRTATLEVTNRLTGSALIHKVDSVTGKGIYGVTFLVSDGKGNPVGQYTSDQDGYVYVDGDLADGKYLIREIQQAEGYLPDTTVKTFYVEYGGCSTITWYNTPCQGQIQIVKTSADYNSTNGWAAGTPIPGCEFEIYNKVGNLVDTIRTDKNGVAASKALPLGQYKVVESKAADFYALDTTPIYAELQYAGQIVRISATNKSVKTGVSITKTGYKEVMPGQTERFTFRDIGNTSTVSLLNFYWRDTIPTDALRLSKVVTGSWNVESSYKIVYLTNQSGGEYRTLADNLSTRKVYTIDASPTALGLASNEYVTEVMAVFGVVPAGFYQVEAPALDFTVVSGLPNGYQFTNKADVGGTYNGAWVQAVTRWVTKVYAPTKPLPRTGY